MRTHASNRPHLTEPAFVGADAKASKPRSARSSNPPTGHRQSQSFISNKQSPRPRNELTQFLVDIDGVPVLVRFLVGDASGGTQSDFVSGDADLRSLFASTVEKMVARMGGSPLRRDDSAKQMLATVELISSVEQLAGLPALSNDTVLRVGPLELDLLDRTARRGDRRIDLRPREFQLLKYMMQRSDELLTRATLLKDVWNYNFTPETNLVDVHMGKLRRKVDGSNEVALIRNVRGVGFVLSATELSYCPTPRPARRTETWPPGNFSRPVERALQCCPVAPAIREDTNSAPIHGANSSGALIMTSFHQFSAFAASRGEGLHPKLRAIFERTVTSPLSEVSTRRDGLIQAGPSRNSEVASSRNNVALFSR